LALAILLLSGWRQEAARRFALVVFVIFGAISLFQAVSGRGSCGCFGDVPVNPLITLTLDCAIVLSLWLARAPSEPLAKQTRPTRAVAVAVFVAAVISVGAYVLVHPQTARLDSPIGQFEAASVVVLEPQRWIGKPLPIGKFVDVGAALERGDWLLVLLHYDCERCREQLPLLQGMARAGKRVALVELPPYASTSEHFRSTLNEFTHGRLASSKRWYVHTPSLIEIRDGMVVSNPATILSR
jgi:hypothetical protein